jgi:hypothetical protein
VQVKSRSLPLAVWCTNCWGREKKPEPPHVTALVDFNNIVPICVAHAIGIQQQTSLRDSELFVAYSEIKTKLERWFSCGFKLTYDQRARSELNAA